MSFDTWFWRGALAIVAVSCVIDTAVRVSRDDPAEACRVQVQASEHRIRDKLWIAGHASRRDAAGLKSDIARLPQHLHINGLPVHWQAIVRVEP